MSQNIVEFLREQAITKLFNVNGFKTAWNVWSPELKINHLNKITASTVYNLGDKLRDIFYLTNTGDRSQSAVSGGGANWEALVCYYLNLCLIGRRTVVVKHNKALMPTPISDAITVNYGNFISNTESDLIAITFPEKSDYTVDKEAIEQLSLYNKKGEYDLLGVLNYLTDRDFKDIGIHIIQCKTNWNDNAQIPMLWNMIYSAKDFASASNIRVGRNGYRIAEKVASSPMKFSYSFVTVPTVDPSKFKPNSTSVRRVQSLSGGNYWGMPDKSGIAQSVKYLLDTNFLLNNEPHFKETLSVELKKLNSTYSYFNL